MGPIYITAIVTDGDFMCLDCADKAGARCDEHGAWLDNCTRKDEREDWGVVNNLDEMDGSECCGRCTEPLDADAFDQWLEDEKQRDGEREYADACAICHSDSCSC